MITAVPVLSFITGWPGVGKVFSRNPLIIDIKSIQSLLPACLGIFGGFFCAAVIPLRNLFRLFKFREQARLRSFATKGKIRDSELDEVFSNNYYVYTPVITYEYAVGKKRYVGTYLPHPTSHHNIMPLHERCLKKFPLESEVNVYLDPENPGNSSLKHGTAAGFLLRSIWLLTMNIAAAAVMGATITILIRGFIHVSLIWKIIMSLIVVAIMVGQFFYARWSFRDTNVEI